MIGADSPSINPAANFDCLAMNLNEQKSIYFCQAIDLVWKKIQHGIIGTLGCSERICDSIWPFSLGANLIQI